MIASFKNGFEDIGVLEFLPLKLKLLGICISYTFKFDNQSIDKMIIEKFIQDTEQSNGDRQLRVLPTGRLAAIKQTIASGLSSHYRNVRATKAIVLRGVNEGLSSHYRNVRATVRGDRITLGLLAISVHNECLVWMNATGSDMYQRDSMIFFNFALAASFGLNRKLWSNITTPLKERMIKTNANLLDCK